MIFRKEISLNVEKTDDLRDRNRRLKLGEENRGLRSKTEVLTTLLLPHNSWSFLGLKHGSYYTLVDQFVITTDFDILDAVC